MALIKEVLANLSRQLAYWENNTRLYIVGHGVYVRHQVGLSDFQMWIHSDFASNRKLRRLHGFVAGSKIVIRAYIHNPAYAQDGQQILFEGLLSDRGAIPETDSLVHESYIKYQGTSYRATEISDVVARRLERCGLPFLREEEGQGPACLKCDQQLACLARRI